MTDNRADNMKRLNADPEFAAKRDERARERFKSENERLQKMANIAKRGCDVPASIEADWKSLKQMKITNREAASMLKIPWLGEPEDEDDARWASRRACNVVDELIDLVETNTRLDSDFAYELVERSKRIKRILAWNTQGQAL